MRERLGDGPVYVSVDIDVIDPGMAPGTGTPEAGGLTSRELLATLRGLAGLDVVSADIVEVAPAYDHAEVTGIAAAHVGYELLAVIASDSRGTRWARARSSRASSRDDDRAEQRTSGGSRSARSTTYRSASGTASCGTSARCGS